MSREIFPFSLDDDTNPYDVDFRPKRVIGDDAPKASSAPESATDSFGETTAPAPETGASSPSTESNSDQPKRTDDTPSPEPEAQEAPATVVKVPTPVEPPKPVAAKRAPRK